MNKPANVADLDGLQSIHRPTNLSKHEEKAQSR